MQVDVAVVMNGNNQPPTKYSTFIDNENYDSEGAPLCSNTKKHSRFTYSQPPLPSPSATLPPPEGESRDIRHTLAPKNEH